MGVCRQSAGGSLPDLSQPETQVLIIVGLAALLVGMGLGVLLSFRRGRGRTDLAKNELRLVNQQRQLSVLTPIQNLATSSSKWVTMVVAFPVMSS